MSHVPLYAQVFRHDNMMIKNNADLANNTTQWKQKIHIDDLPTTGELIIVAILIWFGVCQESFWRDQKVFCVLVIDLENLYF